MKINFLLVWIIIKKFTRFIKLSIQRFKFKYVFSIKKGKSCYIGLGLRINNPQNIALHNKVSLADNTRMWSELSTGKLILHDSVQINRNVLLDFTGFLEVKENALISEGAKIYTHSHGYDPRSEPKGSKLTIAENAWIGTNAIILPSVNYIGKNAIIGAGAIVSKDVPDNHVYICSEGRLVEKKREYNDD